MKIENMDRNTEIFFSDLEYFGIKLGLDQTRMLFAKLGNPEKKIRFIHIAGTNGKGSVGALLAAGLSEAGFKTAFYSSPHLVDICERFRIDGKAISNNELAVQVAKIEPIICELRKLGIDPTYFEVTTAIAAAYFAENNVDFVIWEVGMGGRFDATNIITPEISIITGISLDHTAHLGTSIEKIAKEKAGIIKMDKPIFCGELPQDAQAIIAKIAAHNNSPLYLTEDNGSAHGNYTYKQKNAKLAKKVLCFLSEKFHFNLNVATIGMKRVRWPCRLQELNCGTIIDGAHNPQAAEALVSSLKYIYPDRKYSIIFASLRDKDTIKVLKILAGIAEEFIFPEFHCSRGALKLDELKKMANSVCNLKITLTEDFATAYTLSEKDTLITGSLYLAGAALIELANEDDILNIY